MDFLQRAVVAPPGEVVMHRAARRQVFRNIAPLTSSAQHVHQAVDHLTHINRPLAAAALGGRQQRPDMLPFRVGQVARVTQLVTVVERAVFGGPHAGSRGCSPAGTHRGVEPVKRIHPPPITASNDSQSLRTYTDTVRVNLSISVFCCAIPIILWKASSLGVASLRLTNRKDS